MAYKIEVQGIVQGVGFRPYIYSLARSMGLGGYVSNNESGAVIVLDASKERTGEFVEAMLNNAPSLCKIDSYEIQSIEGEYEEFSILESKAQNVPSVHIPPEVAMCSDCLAELEDKNNPRFGYPFITCTSCGPRYSIIKNLPYDRENTSMDVFEMCGECEAEYKDPSDRRYHAQTIGCRNCGPKLSFFDSKGDEIKAEDIIEEAAKKIKEGMIIALKGIGGYHLICDASNDKAVRLLRERKRRPAKPFAVMVKDIKSAKGFAYINEKEEALLLSNVRPIVLLASKEDSLLSLHVAPAIGQIGLFLPYTPLHHLLMQKLDAPIVATSANISEEPLCKDRGEIMRLNGVWDFCLDHDREIVNSCDDSVLFVENDNTFMLRSARGYAPSYLHLPKKADKKILALGANQKSSVAIVLDDSAVLSPYIGDLESLSGIEHYKAHIETLKRIYAFEPDVIVHDKHPLYESTKYAKELKAENSALELIEVQHHYAHILATMGANDISSKVLGVSFDGTGYGDEGNLWGGEFLLCDSDGYERVGHFKYFRLLGGEKAIKEPRRVALGFLFELYGEDALQMKNYVTAAFTHQELKALFISWQKGLSAPLSSSCGRLFDAVASALGVVQVCSYEGESGLLLESLYDESIKDCYVFEVQDGEIDFVPIFKQILDERDLHVAVSKFFNTLIEIIYFFSKRYGLPLVVGGGVFQNRVLLRLLMQRIPGVIVPHGFVSNDGAIAYGQVLAALK